MSPLEKYIETIKQYDGPPVKLMEVCGTHTAAIARSGIRSLLPPQIELVSGPGCPVCVTATSYIDELCALSKKENTCVASFGDMLRVPGSSQNLLEAKAEGGRVHMMYSPFDLLKLAKENPETTYVFAAVGFETTAPLYALLLDRALQAGIQNIRLLTALKTMPPVIEWLLAKDCGITGFIAPGHVSVITGAEIFAPLAEKGSVPFVVTGFEPEQILASVCLLLQKQGVGKVYNLYTSAVKENGNPQARAEVEKFFEPCDASWRGLGLIPGSGIALRKEYEAYDMGSRALTKDAGVKKGCCCGTVLMGKMLPSQCPLFGKVCTPQNPTGACMVSSEGSCRVWYETGAAD